MGSIINPVAFRLGIINFWSNLWNVRKSYYSFLFLQDFLVQRLLSSFFFILLEKPSRFLAAKKNLVARGSLSYSSLLSGAISKTLTRAYFPFIFYNFKIIRNISRNISIYLYFFNGQNSQFFFLLSKFFKRKWNRYSVTKVYNFFRYSRYRRFSFLAKRNYSFFNNFFFLKKLRITGTSLLTPFRYFSLAYPLRVVNRAAKFYKAIKNKNTLLHYKMSLYYQSVFLHKMLGCGFASCFVSKQFQNRSVPVRRRGCFTRFKVLKLFARYFNILSNLRRWRLDRKTTSKNFKIYSSPFFSKRRFPILLLIHLYLNIKFFSSLRKYLFFILSPILEKVLYPNIIFIGTNSLVLTAALVSTYVRFKLRQYFPLKTIIYPLFSYLNSRFSNPTNYFLGYKILCSGRFARRDRATYLWQSRRSVPFSTITAPVDFSSQIFTLKYSACSVKVWLYCNNKEYYSSNRLRWSVF